VTGEIKSSPYQAPMHQYGGSIVLLTNPDNELYKAELTFRGIKLDADGKPQQVGDALMNDEGVAAVLGLMQSIVSQVTVMSNFNKHEVPLLIDFLGDTLAEDLMLNRVKYEIHNQAARNRVFFTALTTSFVTLKRAYEEGDKRFWKGSQQEIISRVESNTHKKGALSSLIGFGR
jgi:hypothetical protein